MQVIPVENGVPIFSWCPNAEENAMEQMRIIAGLPFVKHCALMPDGHLGNDCCVGGVVACSDVIVPNFVGVDISCGMASFKTNINVCELTEEKKQIIHHAVERSIPMGFSHNDAARCKNIASRFGQELEDMFEATSSEIRLANKEDAVSQLGTLGGGNHMIELQYDENGSIWCLVHSGSRNIGKKVCDYFNEAANNLNRIWHSKSIIPFLPIDSPEGQEYLIWMNLCVRFSFLNRKAMTEDVIDNLSHYFPNLEIVTNAVSQSVRNNLINISHNYASIENFGNNRNWVVHRKGAVLARDGVIGIIPGSQSTNSFITVGLGNEKSLNSSSHGAGRKMGRKEFNIRNQSKVQEIEEEMATKGIIFSKFKKSERGRDSGMYDLSESGAAYKDILSIMEQQKDLVKPIVKLTPVVNWKG